MAYKVFVSYSTRDFPNVEALRSWLQVPQVEVFISEYAVPPGAPLAATIQQWIKNCDLFVLLWSANANVSEWVPQEIGIAKACSKPILPIALQDGVSLPGFIKELRYIAAFRDQQDGMRQLREYVLTNSLMKQSQTSVLAALGIGALLIWALSKSK
jgi:hypothetical protein